MNRTITLSVLAGVLIFVMWFGVEFFLISKMTEVKVMPDPSVSPPVERHGDHPNISEARIVVNIRNDGTVTGQDLQVLETDEAIAEYISKCRDKFDSEGLVPKLHLRGAQEPMFKYSRRVIKIANEQGVTKVVFAAYEDAASLASGDEGEKPIDLNKHATPPKTGLADLLPGFMGIRPREQDLNMALPTPINQEEIGDSVIIAINAQGHILYGKDEQVLDQDTTVRDLPLLKAELENAKKRAGNKKVLVTMRAAPDTSQQRVIDVLNALAACGISSVTVADLIEEKKAPEEQKIELQREIEQGRQNIHDIEAFVEMERAKLKENPDYDRSFLDEALQEQKGIRETIESNERRLQELGLEKK